MKLKINNTQMKSFVECDIEYKNWSLIRWNRAR